MVMVNIIGVCQNWRYNMEKISTDVLVNLGINLFLLALEKGPEIISAIKDSDADNKEELLNRIKVAQDRLDEWL
jgi:hypothetical protein